MSDLVGFLLARVAEDEAIARAASLDAYGNPAMHMDWDYGPGSERDMTPAQDELHREWSPWRVLAECEAKRRIVERCKPLWIIAARPVDIQAAGVVHPGAQLTIYGKGGPLWPNDTAEPILRALALPYADHADYRDEWKP